MACSAYLRGAYSLAAAAACRLVLLGAHRAWVVYAFGRLDDAGPVHSHTCQRRLYHRILSFVSLPVAMIGHVGHARGLRSSTQVSAPVVLLACRICRQWLGIRHRGNLWDLYGMSE